MNRHRRCAGGGQRGFEMDEFFKGLLDKAPDIIGKAAQSPLGVASLSVLVLGTLAFLLFRDATGKLKLAALAMITGFLGFLVKVVIVASNPTRTDNPEPEPRISQEQTEQVRIGDKLLGVWRGQYSCLLGQGGVVELSLTGLTDGGEIRGTFLFYNSYARGSYSVTGAYDRRTNTLRVDPAGWIQQPPAYLGYSPAGFLGSPNKAATHFEGSFIGQAAAASGCTRIILNK
jgi:hypothetical protein